MLDFCISNCLLPAIGLYVSMARQQTRGGEPQSADRVARFSSIFGVWIFFSLISIWNVKCSAPFFTRVDLCGTEPGYWGQPDTPLEAGVRGRSLRWPAGCG